MHKKCSRCRQWERDYDKDVTCDSCPDGTYKNTFNFLAVSTVSFSQNKNVPISRIKMIKRRKLASDGKNGEVVLTNHAGKELSRRASDY